MASSAAFGAAVLMFGVGSGVAGASGSCGFKITSNTGIVTISNVNPEPVYGWTRSDDPSRWVKISETTYRRYCGYKYQQGDSYESDSGSNKSCSGFSCKTIYY